jgi:HlyD family secretion protein
MVLKPGMTANVTIIINNQQDVIKVPAAALRFKPAGAVATAWQGRPQGAGQDGAYAMSDSSAHPHPDSTMGNRMNHSRVWVLDEKRNPRRVPVEIGISDGSFTQIVTGNLKEGDSVITSQEGVAATSSSNQQVNPFMPRFGGGPGGRR